MKIIRTRNYYARNRLRRVKTELPPLYSMFQQALGIDIIRLFAHIRVRR